MAAEAYDDEHAPNLHRMRAAFVADGDSEADGATFARVGSHAFPASELLRSVGDDPYGSDGGMGEDEYGYNGTEFRRWVREQSRRDVQSFAVAEAADKRSTAAMSLDAGTDVGVGYAGATGGRRDTGTTDERERERDRYRDRESRKGTRCPICRADGDPGPEWEIVLEAMNERGLSLRDRATLACESYRRVSKTNLARQLTPAILLWHFTDCAPTRESVHNEMTRALLTSLRMLEDRQRSAENTQELCTIVRQQVTVAGQLSKLSDYLPSIVDND